MSTRAIAKKPKELAPPAPAHPRSQQPPPLPVLDTEALRRRLAGLADPFATGLKKGCAEDTSLRETASDFCLLLCRQFGNLERTTLWDRIGSGLAVACAKVHDGNLEVFFSLVLEHVKADVGAAATDKGFAAILATVATWPAEVRYAFVEFVRSRLFVVVANAKARWEEYKALNQTASKVARKEAANGGA